MFLYHPATVYLYSQGMHRMLKARRGDYEKPSSVSEPWGFILNLEEGNKSLPILLTF